MNTDPALFIGTVKIVVKGVTDQSAFYANHISRENIGKKVKRPRGPKSKSGPGSTNKKAFAKLKSGVDHQTTEGSTSANQAVKGVDDAFLVR
jgi:hypothetical protein